MSIISKLLEKLDEVVNPQVMDSMEDETGLNEVTDSKALTEEYEEDDELGLYIQTTGSLYDKYIAPAQKGMGKVAWDKLIDDAVNMYKKEIEDVDFTDEQKQSAKEYVKNYYDIKEDFEPAKMEKAEYKDMKIEKPEEEKAPIKEEVAELLNFKIGEADCTATDSTGDGITAEDVKAAIEKENPAIFFNDADGYHYIMDFSFEKDGKTYWIESKHIEGDFSKFEFNVYKSEMSESRVGSLLRQCEELKVEVELKDDGEIEVEVKPDAKEDEEKEEETTEENPVDEEPTEELPTEEQAPIEESRAEKIRKGAYKRVKHESLNEDKYTEVESLIEEIFGKVGTEVGTFRLYKDNATAFVAKNREKGGVSPAILRGKNLKELALKLEAVKEYKNFQEHPEYFKEAVEGLGESQINEINPESVEEVSIKRQLNSLNAEAKANQTGKEEDKEEAEKLADKADKNIKLTKKWRKAKGLTESVAKIKVAYGTFDGEKGDSVVYKQKVTANLTKNELKDLNEFIKVEGDKNSYDKMWNKPLKDGINYATLTQTKLFKQYFDVKRITDNNTIIVINTVKDKITEAQTVIASYDNGKHEIVKCDKGYFNKYNITEGKARFTTKCVKNLPTAIGALKKRFPEAEEDK